VFTDLRGARLKPATLDWTTAQAAANAGVIPETYDETTGAWKFNAPMIGFGAGAYVLALQPPSDAACGAYFDEGSTRRLRRRRVAAVGHRPPRWPSQPSR